MKLNIPDIGNMLLSGLISEYAPAMFKGMLLELLKDVSVAQASEWVINNYPLWEKIPPETRSKICQNASRLGDISWFTADWVIGSLKDDKPALASLFTGWKKGHNWMERQVEIFRQEMGDNDGSRSQAERERRRAG